MRLRLLTIVGTAALALAAPSAALAHHGHGRHHHKAKAHHAKFRFEQVSASGVSGPSSSPSSTVQTPTPATPEDAGEVTSYSTTTNLLVLTLNDKSTVSGKVTSDTRIECVSATPATGAEPGDERAGDDSGQGDDQSRGDMSQGDRSEGAGDNEDGGDDDGEAAGTESPCDSSLLETGRKVRAAELRIGPSGAEFESIVVVR